MDAAPARSLAPGPRRRRPAPVTWAVAAMITAAYAAELAVGEPDDPALLVRLGALERSRVWAGELWPRQRRVPAWRVGAPRHERGRPRPRRRDRRARARSGANPCALPRQRRRCVRRLAPRPRRRRRGCVGECSGRSARCSPSSCAARVACGASSARRTPRSCWPRSRPASWRPASSPPASPRTTSHTRGFRRRGDAGVGRACFLAPPGPGRRPVQRSQQPSSSRPGHVPGRLSSRPARSSASSTTRSGARTRARPIGSCRWRTHAASALRRSSTTRRSSGPTTAISRALCRFSASLELGGRAARRGPPRRR